MSNITVVDQDNIRVLMNDIITQYCERKDINENNIPPAIWNDIIDELYEVIFSKNKHLLKDIPAINNAYNIDKVLYIYKLYRRICNSHCQEITLKGFEDLTGIDHQTFYNWRDKASSIGFDLHQKIMADNEQSLEAMLHDKRINPMKVLPSLNKKHGWNLPGVSKETTKTTGLTAADLPQLGQPQIVQIEQKTED